MLSGRCVSLFHGDRYRGPRHRELLSAQAGPGSRPEAELRTEIRARLSCGEPAMRSAARSTTRLVWLLVGILALCALARPVIPGVLMVLPLGDHVSVSNLQPEQGLAYTAKLGDPALSDHEKPTHAALYLIESRRGSVLNRVPAALGESFAFSWLRALFEARFPASTYDVRIPLGPGQALHQEIRDKGDGRYSVWHGTVYFSLPPGVPLARVHRLDLVVPRFLSADSARIAKEIRSALAWSGAIAALRF